LTYAWNCFADAREQVFAPLAPGEYRPKVAMRLAANPQFGRVPKPARRPNGQLVNGSPLRLDIHLLILAAFAVLGEELGGAGQVLADPTLHGTNRSLD
jgi:hypothetical protein